MRRQVGLLLGAAACTVLVPLTASLAFGPVPPEAMPTSAATPGTCHVAADPNELAATISDTAPPVPCDRPHQTETVWIHQIDGPLAREVERPNPELLGATLDTRCDDYTRLRAYLGAEPKDKFTSARILPLSIVLLWALLLFGGIKVVRRRHLGHAQKAIGRLAIVLVTAAVSQFAVVMLSEGLSDLRKHLIFTNFLTGLCVPTALACVWLLTSQVPEDEPPRRRPE